MSKHSNARPEKLRAAVMKGLDKRIAYFEKDVLWNADAAADGLVGMQAIYPLAYFYSTRFKGNTYYRDPNVLRTAQEMGDFLSACSGPDRPAKYDACFRRLIPCYDWVLLFWTDACGELRDHLPEKTLRRWRRSITDHLKHYEHRIKGFAPQERFTSYSFDTSPNHAISYAICLYVAGRIWNREGWMRLAEDFGERYARYQTPAGYWPEGHGPVTIYQSISLAGIARFHALTGKKVYREALERAVPYTESILYPDHRVVCLVDRRTRHHSLLPTGMYGLTVSPRGRSLAKAVVDARLARGKTPGDARMLENYVHWNPGNTPRFSPWRGHRFIENHTCMFRDRGWQFNLSANPQVVHPHSPFRLDHGTHFSVWHPSVGLIVSGQQDKKNPLHNTFVPSGEELGILHGGRIGNRSNPRFLDACHSEGFTGRIAIEARSHTSLRIQISNVGPRRVKAFGFNVPLFVHTGDTVRVNGKDHVLKDSKTLKIRVPPGATVSIWDRQISIRSSAGATLHYPCKPWNPYSKGNRSSPGEWFARLEVPVRGKRGSATVDIETAK